MVVNRAACASIDPSVCTGDVADDVSICKVNYEKNGCEEACGLNCIFEHDDWSI
jgi:hypothetical protein